MPLPGTKHDLTDASKFSVDAWQTGSLLPAVCIYIMVHGEYEQTPVRGRGYTKSFDRSFIIAPAPPNSRYIFVLMIISRRQNCYSLGTKPLSTSIPSAAQHGWKCLIISDQLTVRQHNGHEAWQPEPELHVPGTVSSAVSSAFNAAGGAPPMTDAAIGTTAIAPSPAAGVGPDPNQTPMQGIVSPRFDFLSHISSNTPISPWLYLLPTWFQLPLKYSRPSNMPKHRNCSS